MNLGKQLKVTRVLNAVVAGTTAQNCTTLDMAGWDGVLFIAAIGAITAGGTPALKAQQGQQSGGGDLTDLEGTATTLTDAMSNKAAVLDLYRPQERYVRAIVTRAGANAVIDGVIAIQYKGRSAPFTEDTTVGASKYLQSPAEGTA